MSTPARQLEIALAPADPGSHLRVKVVPNASRSRIAGVLGDRLKVQLSAPPEAGRANKALCELIARQLGVKKADVTLHAGHAQPHKTIAITTLGPEEIARRLSARMP